jgi:oxygen-independent coproporphyrinogen-3 oxidase
VHRVRVAAPAGGPPSPAPDWEAGGFGLYLHWPFCAAKCPYCDFNSHVTASVDEARWARAFEAEIARTARDTGPRVLRSIFLGGGTPSLMSPDLVGRVLAAARAAWSVAPEVEITLEANPTSVEAGRFRGFRDAGVNRVSLGVQALDDGDLRRLGRLHDAAQALAAVETARATFERVSFDLIYARQHQTLAAWQAELRRALSLGPDHLSLYQLTIEDGTPFAARHRAGGLAGLPDDDLAADLYDATQALCEAAGLPAYEVSNHAVPGAEGRHNLTYWRSGDWAGIGPGAHGRLTLGGTRWATEAHRMPEAWLRGAEAGSAEAPRSAVPASERAEELLMMGLRLREGVSLARHAALGGRRLPEGTVRELREMGLVAAEGDRLRVTAQGRPVLNGVLRALLEA